MLYRASPPLENATWQRLGNPSRNGHTFYSQPTAVLPYPYDPDHPYHPYGAPTVAPTTSDAHAHAQRPPGLQRGGEPAAHSRRSRLLLYLGDRWNELGLGSVG